MTLPPVFLAIFQHQQYAYRLDGLRLRRNPSAGGGVILPTCVPTGGRLDSCRRAAIFMQVVG